MGKVLFQESTINLTHGRKGKVAVFMFQGDEDPVEKLNSAVSQYVGNQERMEFVDINMDNPWTRVVISGINDMEQVEFDPLNNKLKS